MVDTITRTRRSANMARIRSKDMKPELIVRRLVHSLGYRYRLHRKDLPGKPDLVFGPRRKVMFIHGCFWHQHGGCLEGRTPKSNQEYWAPKLSRNVERDRRVQSELANAGWAVMVIWECETPDTEALTDRIHEFLG
jgi:DNA mismatch endonuclease (patch repair protein)